MVIANKVKNGAVGVVDILGVAGIFRLLILQGRWYYGGVGIMTSLCYDITLPLT